MEKHYICTGGCRGVSQIPGVCQAPDCKNHNHDLIECNCTDNLHNNFKKEKLNFKKIIVIISKIIVVVILFQTLPYKFGGLQESIDLFTKLNIEPWGRYVTGTLELIFGSLIIFKKTSKIGALGVMFIMSGAILSHIFILGIDPLFFMGILVFISAFTVFKLEQK